MDQKTDIFLMGDNWGSYRKKHYSSAEIAENNPITELAGEIINAEKEQWKEIYGKKHGEKT